MPNWQVDLSLWQVCRPGALWLVKTKTVRSHVSPGQYNLILLPLGITAGYVNGESVNYKDQIFSILDGKVIAVILLFFYLYQIIRLYFDQT